MNRETRPPRWLIVVRRERRDLYENLRRSFEPESGVAVILDRREEERRKATASVEPDRRRKDRRAAPTATELDSWETAGFRVIHQDVDLTVYQAEQESS